MKQSIILILLMMSVYCSAMEKQQAGSKDQGQYYRYPSVGPSTSESDSQKREETSELDSQDTQARNLQALVQSFCSYLETISDSEIKQWGEIIGSSSEKTDFSELIQPFLDTRQGQGTHEDSKELSRVISEARLSFDSDATESEEPTPFEALRKYFLKQGLAEIRRNVEVQEHGPAKKETPQTRGTRQEKSPSDPPRRLRKRGLGLGGSFTAVSKKVAEGIGQLKKSPRFVLKSPRRMSESDIREKSLAGTAVSGKALKLLTGKDRERSFSSPDIEISQSLSDEASHGSTSLPSSPPQGSPPKASAWKRSAKRSSSSVKIGSNRSSSSSITVTNNDEAEKGDANENGS